MLKKHQRYVRSLFFLVVPLMLALYAGPPAQASHTKSAYKWGSPAANVDISDPSFPSSWISPLSASMAAWNNAGSRFRFSSANTGNKIYRASLAADKAGDTWAYTAGGRIYRVETVMNSNKSWSTTGSTCCLDVQNVLTHELGHWLYLYDTYQSSDSALTMYGYGVASAGETKKRTLEWDDLNSIRAMYP